MNDEPASLPRSAELLSRAAGQLVVVDVQEKLLAHIPVGEQLVENCRRLIVGAGLLGVPVLATEQYPGGLGPTAAPLAELLGEIPEKLRFSCAESLALGDAADRDDGRDQVVICGIESHVCVLQTALDLLAHGFRVHVVADAVASRHELDWRVALERMADSGVVVTTMESVLFEWCETAGDEKFREISRLVTAKED